MQLHKLAAILSAMIRHTPAPIVLTTLLRSVLPYVFAGCGHFNTPFAVGVRWPASLPWHVPQAHHRCQNWENPGRVKGPGKAGNLPGNVGA